MKPNEAEFLEKLRSAFRIEAEEHLQAMSSGLLELEKEQDPSHRDEIIATIFREAHSLKGAARAVNSAEIETICQAVETVFAGWKRHVVQPSPEMFDPLHKAVNAAARMLPSAQGNASELTADEMSALLNALARGASAGMEAASQPDLSQPSQVTATPSASASADQDRGVPPSARPPSMPVKVIPIPRSSQVSPNSMATGAMPAVANRSASPSAAPETLRISTAKLDALLLQAEEMLAVKLTATQRAADLRQLAGALEQWEREWTRMLPEVRAACESLAKDAKQSSGSSAAKFAAFMESSGEQIKSLQGHLTAHVKEADHDRRATTGMVDSLLNDAKKLLMLPCSTLLEPFPKMVRDLSRDQGKEVDLIVSGDDVEIDKRVLGEMRDPLIHLLRNAVDHGIEPPALRTRGGKTPRGSIRVAVSQVDGTKIEIVVSDDGRGINPADVNEAAVRRGVISASEARSLDDQEALWLIFRPDVSTSPMITEISGRGLGMSIVKEKVERLGGRIALETHPGQGTTFRLLLPLTLATFRGLLVHAGGQPFIIPTSSVERVMCVAPNDVQTIEMRETIRLNGRVVSLVRLHAVLGMPPSPAKEKPKSIYVVVLAAGERRVGFSVDEILNEQEVLVKRLGMPLVRVRNIAGATVLGSGKAVAILNADDLLKSAVKGGAPAGAGSGISATGASAETSRKSILVAEDSITARMLIKSILESAGHAVKTAVDGQDALTLLKTEPFDLVVSDVEMPRMSGFELTEKIRADVNLAELPVVLVTALASREHRERGVDAGANAYIVKSSFDQTNLLEVVQRLL